MWYNGTIIHNNDLEGIRGDKLHVVQYTYMYMIIYIVCSLLYL